MSYVFWQVPSSIKLQPEKKVQSSRRRQLGGGGGSLAAAAAWRRRLRILVSLISSMVDGLKSCDVEAFYVCDFLTLICESRSTVPRGPPRLELDTVLILAAWPVLVLIYHILVLVGWYFGWYFEH
jgi:hypothetical protein